MLELFIQQLLSFLEAPLTQMGLSPVAVLRGAELFIIVALTVFGAFFMRRVIVVLSNVQVALDIVGMTPSFWHSKVRRA